ncbi:MAG: pseudouridine-5'-phosphate glycosidase [Spirochaetaceae bacterium]|nr:MAG: pseudouridine-5'-phosphate glycosidase [Spirochaetaceae bacterium]
MREFISIRNDVAESIREQRPMIALESTIIAHGLPRPRNVEIALQAEEEARKLGVVPATVGILEGKVVIGLTPEQIEHVGTAEEVLKVSRRDFAYALATRRLGATTVCGTMMAAHLAGLRVFATGGIGGVHRGAEQSFDISADLLELARTPMIVVSAGAKAILDLPKTLEFLETRGVPVIGYKTSVFPAFYSVESELVLDLVMDSPEQIAAVYRTQRSLGFEQGLLVANPVPKEHEIPRQAMERYLGTALAELDREGISGKQVTPFLLARVLELSGGRSLQTNIELLFNNVRLACGIARNLSAGHSGR